MAFWNRQRGRQDHAESSDPEAAEPIEFTPRTDGRYRGPSPDGMEWIRFAEAAALVGLDAGGPAASGEYSDSGRFTVIRQFQRPIVFTVLLMELDEDGRLAAFRARRTDTAPGAQVAEVEYRFGTP